ncbi:hypothetical protein [Streptomyces sp. NRRL WC-3725]|uniref:hypothetical protein n=1 Tax=Streptomyces sp. NRRL WC-3725 TaxID=1463933 RepID=UPI00131D6576|nr:hypothetical protein [Streptomyces sp. NRRL WC-3725]
MISLVLARATLDLRSVVWWLPRALAGRPAIGRELFSGAPNTTPGHVPSLPELSPY